MALQKLDDPALGARLLRLRTPARAPLWITRRSDIVSFLDYATVQRDVALELYLGDDDGGGTQAPEVGGCLLLPIANFAVGKHTTIDAFDEKGALLPRLTKEEERTLVFAGVKRLACMVLKTASIEPDVEQALRNIVVLRSVAPERIRDLGAKVEPLTVSQEFMGIVRDAYLFYYLIIALPKPTPERRVITLRYLERFAKRLPTLPSDAVALVPTHQLTLKWYARFVAWLWDGCFPCPGHSLTLHAIEAGQCGSYHLEVVAPYDLVFEARATLTVLPVTPGSASIKTIDDSPSVGRVHVHWTRDDAVVMAWLRTRLIPVPTGLLRTTTVSVTAIFALLAIGSIYVWTTPPVDLKLMDAPSATALLLLAPAVFGTCQLG